MGLSLRIQSEASNSLTTCRLASNGDFEVWTILSKNWTGARVIVDLNNGSNMLSEGILEFVKP